jgi:hypothetical protein
MMFERIVSSAVHNRAVHRRRAHPRAPDGRSAAVEHQQQRVRPRFETVRRWRLRTAANRAPVDTSNVRIEKL